MVNFNNSLHTSTGEFIGMDFRYYRIQPETKNTVVLRGYEMSKTIHSFKHKSNPTIRKWLSLRLHAFERGIHFSDEMDTKFIDSMMSKINGVCPYTKQTLTIGELKDSDWSIDRICNEFGYIPLNVVIMTTGFNSAKSNMGYSEIKTVVERGCGYKGYKLGCWALLLKDIEIARELLTNTKAIKNEVDFHLRSGEALIRFYIQNILNSDSEYKKKMYALGLLSINGIDLTVKNKLESLVRKFVIKSGNTHENDVNVIMTRSASLRREVAHIGRLLPMDDVVKSAADNKKRMIEQANEANNSTRI